MDHIQLILRMKLSFSKNCGCYPTCTYITWSQLLTCQCVGDWHHISRDLILHTTRLTVCWPLSLIQTCCGNLDIICVNITSPGLCQSDVPLCATAKAVTRKHQMKRQWKAKIRLNKQPCLSAVCIREAEQARLLPRRCFSFLRHSGGSEMEEGNNRLRERGRRGWSRSEGICCIISLQCCSIDLRTDPCRRRAPASHLWRCDI